MTTRNTLSLTATVKMITFALRANIPLHLIGSPGIGKTAILGMVTKTMGVPLYTLILSQCLPEDIGGALDRDPGSKSIVRYPLGPIAQAAVIPGVLFLDEWSQSGPAMQGAALRGLQERVFGDTPLHPDSRIVLASNPANESSGGHDATLPALNRVTTIHVRPEAQECREYFAALGAQGSALQALAVDFSATTDVEPGLFQLEPPKGASAREENWGSPRAWERGLRLCSEILAGGESDESDLFFEALIGSVGEASALGFINIRKVRKHLPSEAEIRNDPKNAKLPHDTATCCASLGIIAQVALQDPCAAWVYTDRLPQAEFQAAAGRSLLARPINVKATSPHLASAQRARAKILGMVGANIGGV